MNPAARQFERALERALDRYGVLRRGESALVAVSGGPDSTALLAALAALAPRRGVRLFAFHVDHGVRGEESRADCRAARALARLLGVPFRSVKLADPAPRASEDALRLARRSAIEAEARRRGATTILLGHHADDLAETALMRLVRGAGLEGLAAFRPREPWNDLLLARPLIDFTRARILEYLAARGLSYRIDSSNEDPRFLRNRIRRQALPLLADIANPRVREALARGARLLQTDADLLGRLASEILERRARFYGAAGAVLDVEGWATIHEALRTRVLREVCRRVRGEPLPPYARHLADLDRLALRGRGGSHVTGWRGVAAYREGKRLRFLLPSHEGRPRPEDILRALKRQIRAETKAG